MTDEYLSRDELESLFDGLAVGSGRTRAEFDADVAHLREFAASAEHLAFREVDNMHNLPDARKEHVNDCTYCKRLVAAMYAKSIDVASFEQRVREELARMPARKFRLLPAVTMIAGLILGIGAARVLNVNARADRAPVPAATARPQGVITLPLDTTTPTRHSAARWQRVQRGSEELAYVSSIDLSAGDFANHPAILYTTDAATDDCTVRFVSADTLTPAQRLEFARRYGAQARALLAKHAPNAPRNTAVPAQPQ